MNYFYAVVHKDPDSAFGVSFPDLPGCFSAADTLEEVVPNATEALELWFDDQEEIDPSALEVVMASAKDDLANGAFLIAVPRIRSGGRLVRINVSLDSFTVDAIDTEAKARGLTRSAFIATATRHLIEGRA